MHVVVERLQLRELLEVPGCVGPTGELDEAAQHLRRDRLKPVSLAERPLRIRLVGHEVASIEGGGAPAGLTSSPSPAGVERPRTRHGLTLEFIYIEPDALGVQSVAAASAHDRRP